MRDIPGQGAALESTNTQLPVTIQQAEVTSELRALNVVPAIIADLRLALCRFFTANIRNPNTRRAYGNASTDPRCILSALDSPSTRRPLL
jgi:hypothetical protein